MKKLKPTDLKGFVKGEHQPYTDYNQDIVDWLIQHNWKYKTCGSSTAYIFGDKDYFYNQNVLLKSDVYYTNEQFMEWIGMTKKTSENTFTKSDLKDGMICTTRCGYVYTVHGDRMNRSGGFHIMLENISDDLTVDGGTGDLDIVRVEQPTVLFERVDTKQQSIKKELELAEAKKQRLENHISILKSKLK